MVARFGKESIFDVANDKRETGNSKGDKMNADEFRKTMDRFREHLDQAGYAVGEENPTWFVGLDAVCCELNRECAMMKDAETRLITSKHPGKVQPTRPLPPPPESVRGSATEANAEAIGKLQAKVTQLEGEVKSLRVAIESELERVVGQPQEEDVLRLRTPNGEHVKGVVEQWEWLVRPHQEFTEHESALEPGVPIKTSSQWNCGTVRLMVRLTERDGSVPE